MSNQPTLNAFIVTEKKDADGKTTARFWTKVGVLYDHEDGDGFNLVITPGISVNGRIVIRKKKPDEDAGEE